jgi:hypothetical protein
VFYTSFGHVHEIWENAFFQSLVLGGLAWSMGNVSFELTANIQQVTPGAWDVPQRS